MSRVFFLFVPFVAAGYLACVGNDPIDGQTSPAPATTGTTDETEPGESSGGASSSSGYNPVDLGHMTSSSTSSGSTSLVCYPDKDGDSSPGPGATVHGFGTCPARTTTKSEPLDCDDDSADAHPGQTRYFGTQHNGGFDYNCNGSDEKRFFDSAGRERPTFTSCETATTEAACVVRYVERTNGSMPAECGKPTDAALACMWQGGACDVSAFEPMVVRCR